MRTLSILAGSCSLWSDGRVAHGNIKLELRLAVCDHCLHKVLSREVKLIEAAQDFDEISEPILSAGQILLEGALRGFGAAFGDINFVTG